MLHHQRIVQKEPLERFRRSRSEPRSSTLLNEELKTDGPRELGMRPGCGVGQAPTNNSVHADENASVEASLVHEAQSWHFRLLGFTAALTRWLGKLLAILNTAWIVITSLIEFVGGFNNCWCMANTPGLGASGFVVIFKGASDLARDAQLPWATVRIPFSKYWSACSFSTDRSA